LRRNWQKLTGPYFYFLSIWRNIDVCCIQTVNDLFISCVLTAFNKDDDDDDDDADDDLEHVSCVALRTGIISTNFELG